MAQNYQTLSKFGVPLPGGSERTGILQPKQKYRFRVMWYGFGGPDGLAGATTMTANVMTCTRPKITYEEVKLDSYNSVAWIQGKHSFEAIEIKLRDDMTTVVAQTVGAQIQKQMNHFEQTSASAGFNYKFSMEIHSLDGTNNEEIESWFLEGCWLQSTTYSEGDYASGDPQEITLSIRFDNATNVAGQDQAYGGPNPYPNGGSDTSPNLSGGTTFA